MHCSLAVALLAFWGVGAASKKTGSGVGYTESQAGLLWFAPLCLHARVCRACVFWCILHTIGAIDTILDIYKLIFNEFGGYLTHNCELNLRGVQIMMNELGLMEDEVLRDRRKKEKRFDERRSQKAVNITNKQSSKQHLQLIRRLTSNSAAHAVPLGQGGQHGQFTASGDGPGTKRQRLDIQSDAPAQLTHTSVDAFRIKNRGVGGVRVLQAGYQERDAQKLHTMDKIREFCDKTGAKVERKLQLKNLNNMERAVAHEYCEELGLSHDSKGQDPNRYIEIKRPDDVIDPSELTEEDKKEQFAETLKKKIRDGNDALCDLQEDKVDLGRQGWKERYYKDKLDGVNPKDIAREYIGGLVWVFKYYYMGVQSWNWFFPFHYSPFASDCAAVLASGTVAPKFDLGSPFLPYEQLMSVFPSASGSVLPTPFQALMEESSVIGDFYPLEFKLDLNGKRRLWQAVVLLPFIDEKRLLENVRPLEEALEGDEKERNKLGHNYLFVHRSQPLAGLLASAPPLMQAMPKPPSVTKMNELRAAQIKAELDGNKEEEAQFVKELEQVRAEAATYLKAMKLKDGLPIDPSPSCGNGMMGNVSMAPNEPKLGDVVAAPTFEGVRETNPYRPHDLPSNNVVCVIHVNPKAGIHKTTLLPGFTPPPTELDRMDQPNIDTRNIRRPLRFRNQQRAFYQEHSNRRPRPGGPANRMIRGGMGMGMGGGGGPPGRGGYGGGHRGGGQHGGGQHGGGGYGGPPRPYGGPPGGFGGPPPRGFPPGNGYGGPPGGGGGRHDRFNQGFDPRRGGHGGHGGHGGGHSGRGGGGGGGGGGYQRRY